MRHVSKRMIENARLLISIDDKTLKFYFPPFYSYSLILSRWILNFEKQLLNFRDESVLLYHWEENAARSNGKWRKVKEGTFTENRILDLSQENFSNERRTMRVILVQPSVRTHNEKRDALFLNVIAWCDAHYASICIWLLCATRDLDSH